LIRLNLPDGLENQDFQNSKLDLSTLEKVNGSYISDDLRDREDDVIWKVRIGESWVYLYILLEFQSTVDRFMAVRLLTYTGLLYQDLIKSGQVKGKQKLPPVFPLVLYNGEKRWNAATSLTELIDSIPSGLERYLPEYQYLVIDEGSYKVAELEELRNLVAALFRLEHSREPEVVHRIVGHLVEWLGTPETESLRRSFVYWLKRVFLPDRLPESDYEASEELVEVQNMLEKRVNVKRQVYLPVAAPNLFSSLEINRLPVSCYLSFVVALVFYMTHPSWLYGELCVPTGP